MTWLRRLAVFLAVVVACAPALALLADDRGRGARVLAEFDVSGDGEYILLPLIWR